MSKLSPSEKLARRRERLRLIAFLKRGGRLVREDLPAGAVAWCPASRSGPAFHSRAVNNLRRRGAVIRGQKWTVLEEEVSGHLFMRSDADLVESYVLDRLRSEAAIQ